MSGVQTMKIYSILSKLEQLLDESPRPRFSNGVERRIVDVEDFNNLLEELKTQIPEDIRRASGIIHERDNTLRDAREQAKEIVESAEKEAEALKAQAQEAAENVYHQAVTEYEALVSENSVFTEACRRADELQAAAEENAEAICNGARVYADDLLADVQRYLNDYMKVINKNREELDVHPTPEQLPRVTAESVSPSPAVAALPAQKASKPAPVKVKAAPKKAEPEEDDEDDYPEEKSEKPQKKGWFKRMIEGDDEEDDEEEYDEEEETPQPKKRGGLAKLFSSFIKTEDDEEEDYDDEEE